MSTTMGNNMAVAAAAAAAEAAAAAASSASSATANTTQPSTAFTPANAAAAAPPAASPSVADPGASASAAAAPAAAAAADPPRSVDPTKDKAVFADEGHGYIVFPWSDGDPDYKPPNTQPPKRSETEVNYYHVFVDRLEQDPPRYYWRNKIGKELAARLGAPKLAPSGCEWKLKQYPDHYAMTEQRKGTHDSYRTDPYLFGSRAHRFRSALEFVPHAVWLLTDPTRDATNCECKYCPGKTKRKSAPGADASGAAAATAATPSGGASGRKSLKSAAAGGTSRLTKPRDPSLSGTVRIKLQRVDVSRPPTGVPVTSAELRHRELPWRPLGRGVCEGFRVAEVAWGLMTEPVVDPFNGAELDRWPVEIVAHRPQLGADAEREERQYDVVLLGSDEKARLPESRLIPFLGGASPTGLTQSTGKLSEQAWLKTTDQMPRLHLFDDPDLAKLAGPRPAYPTIITSLALAIQLAAHLRGACALLEEFSRKSFKVGPPPTVNAVAPEAVAGAAPTTAREDAAPRDGSEEAAETAANGATAAAGRDAKSTLASAPPADAELDESIYWQGVQLGLERIWVGDVARLRLLPHEVDHLASSLAEHGMLAPDRSRGGGGGALDRDGTYVMRVKGIYLPPPPSAVSTTPATPSANGATDAAAQDTPEPAATPDRPSVPASSAGAAADASAAGAGPSSQTPNKGGGGANGVRKRRVVNSTRLDMAVAGDVYEVVEEAKARQASGQPPEAAATPAHADGDAVADGNANAAARSQFLMPLRPFLDADGFGTLPPAPTLPEGLAYRRVNAEASEVTLNVRHLAGRLWCSLAKADDVAKLSAAAAAAARAGAHETKDVELSRLALAGVVPGYVKSMGVDQRFEWTKAKAIARGMARDFVTRYLRRRYPEDEDEADEAAAAAAAATGAPAATAAVADAGTNAEGGKSGTMPAQQGQAQRGQPTTSGATNASRGAKRGAAQVDGPGGPAGATTTTTTSTPQQPQPASNGAKRARTTAADHSPAGASPSSATPNPKPAGARAQVLRGAAQVSPGAGAWAGAGTGEEEERPLPPGWIVKVSRTEGKKYYAHPELKKTQWARPEA